VIGKLRVLQILKYLHCRKKGEKCLRNVYRFEKALHSSSQKHDYITINFHNILHRHTHAYTLIEKTTRTGFTRVPEKSAVRWDFKFETFRTEEKRNWLRNVIEKKEMGERERGRRRRKCTRAETFSNYKRRHSRTSRRRLFLKQEYSSPPRDIMRKREARSEGAIMAAVMKKSTHPGTQPPRRTPPASHAGNPLDLPFP